MSRTVNLAKDVDLGGGLLRKFTIPPARDAGPTKATTGEIRFHELLK
jgi:hypothetical protein